ncbi:hypothetical protein GCM10028864_31580 [Microlunatus parietis]
MHRDPVSVPGEVAGKVPAHHGQSGDPDLRKFSHDSTPSVRYLYEQATAGGSVAAPPPAPSGDRPLNDLAAEPDVVARHRIL